MEQSSPPGYVAIIARGRDAWPDEEDIERVAKLPQMARLELEMYLDDLRADRLPRGEQPCIWLDFGTRRCRYYDHRPNICRHELVLNDEACHRWRDQYAEVL